MKTLRINAQYKTITHNQYSRILILYKLELLCQIYPMFTLFDLL